MKVIVTVRSTYSMKYGVSSSVYAISQLSGSGPSDELFCIPFCSERLRWNGGGTSSAVCDGDVLADEVSMLERFRRRLPSEDGVWPGSSVPAELVRRKGDDGSLGGFGVP